MAAGARPPCASAHEESPPTVGQATGCKPGAGDRGALEQKRHVSVRPMRCATPVRKARAVNPPRAVGDADETTEDRWNGHPSPVQVRAVKVARRARGCSAECRVETEGGLRPAAEPFTLRASRRLALGKRFIKIVFGPPSRVLDYRAFGAGNRRPSGSFGPLGRRMLVKHISPSIRYVQDLHAVSRNGRSAEVDRRFADDSKSTLGTTRSPNAGDCLYTIAGPARGMT